MRKTLLLLLLIGVYQNLFSQINLNDSTVQIVSYYSKGNNYKYHFQIMELSTADGDTTLLREYDSFYRISVIDSTEHSYLIEANSLNDSYMDTDSTQLLVMQEISKLTKGLKYLYTIDECGRLIGVENWEEMRDVLTKSLDVAINKAYSNTEVKRLLSKEQFLQTIKEQLSTKENLENYLMDEFGTFYMHHGNKYNINEVYEDTLYLINNFNNEEMSVPGQLWVDDIDVENGTVDIIRKAIWQADDLMESAIDYYRKLLVDIPRIDRSDLPFMMIDESFFHRINVDYGWPIFVEHWKEATIGSKGTIRIVRIELVSD